MSTPPAVSRRGRKIILALTPLQVEALYQLCGQANADGDHESWLRGACAPPSEIRACRQAMALVHSAQAIACRLLRP